MQNVADIYPLTPTQAGMLYHLLREDDPELYLEQFRADEKEHHDTAIDHGAEQAPGYELLTGAIKSGTRLAIWLSTRV